LENEQMLNKPSPLLPYEVAELTTRTPLWLRVFYCALQAAGAFAFTSIMLIAGAYVGASW
jgi:hypothetical protein